MFAHQAAPSVHHRNAELGFEKAITPSPSEEKHTAAILPYVVVAAPSALESTCERLAFTPLWVAGPPLASRTRICGQKTATLRTWHRKTECKKLPRQTLSVTKSVQSSASRSPVRPLSIQTTRLQRKARLGQHFKLDDEYELRPKSKSLAIRSQNMGRSPGRVRESFGPIRASSDVSDGVSVHATCVPFSKPINSNKECRPQFENPFSVLIGRLLYPKQYSRTRALDLKHFEPASCQAKGAADTAEPFNRVLPC